VVGSSVHFFDGEDVVSRCSAWGQGEISTADVYPKYLGVLESMLDYDYFDVICHLNLPKKCNQRPSPPAVHWIPASGRFLPSTAGRRFISV